MSTPTTPKTDAQQGGETPRTDAAAFTTSKPTRLGIENFQAVDAEVARQLEREARQNLMDAEALQHERDTIQAQAASLQSQLQGAKQSLEATDKDRLEWKAIAERLDAKCLHEQRDHNKTVDALIAIRSQLADAQKEVGETKRKLGTLRQLVIDAGGDSVGTCEEIIADLTASKAHHSAQLQQLGGRVALLEGALADAKDRLQFYYECVSEGTLEGDVTKKVIDACSVALLRPAQEQATKH